MGVFKIVDPKPKLAHSAKIFKLISLICCVNFFMAQTFLALKFGFRNQTSLNRQPQNISTK